ncbi:PREDICTED: F-box/kelch-repeat protein At3g06240-like isoform 2 [Fragaria vesca subsp. vesca]|uniref:F-box/kelch-repeat protein At3g06240-like isoform X1 n=1 Tax=Fragaria vesca subsp. vesca TaxID=101020 RepID=UPI0002C32913|nr:PREDICTED: F-box/kelch-repeat protein At3g06240-like isoform X1 [Fragaria vesca subsp. vesca]
MADELTELPHLPMEIIREILAWLPVKPLCRFRCVSKSWNSLTFDPKFVKMHFNKALEHEDVLHQRRRVLVTGVYSGEFYSFSLDEFLDNDDIDNVGCDDENHELSVTEVSRVGDVRGSSVFYSNALMLFESNQRFSLFNPVTRESKVVPVFPKLGRCDIINAKLYGFGFDPSTQDYKMVYMICEDCAAVRRQHPHSPILMELKFGVYSLKTGYWRVIEKGYPYQCLSHGGMGKLLNGGIHWLVYRDYGDLSSMVLLSFVLAEEEVREIPLPPRFHNEGGGVYLSVFRDCLCMILGYGEEVWIMKEYGVRESWTKIRISIPPCEWVHSGFRKKYYDLLLLEDDENKLVLLNFDKNIFRNLSIRGVPEVGYAVVYLESLVSPNNFGITD